MRTHDRMARGRQGFKMGLVTTHTEDGTLSSFGGTYVFDMRDAETGESLVYFEQKNLVVLDAGILVASLLKGDAVNPLGLTMLAVGTGATGNLLSPDAPQPGQRRLNTEIARKAFASKVYRNGAGVAVAYRTNIVDFTTTFGESEAVGPLNEMGLLSAASANPAVTNPIVNGPVNYDPTIDVTGKDVLGNYSPFSVVTKPNTATLSITWRLTL